MKSIDVDLRDVVIYDAEGYPALRDFLKKQGIRHVLLAGYNTDMCFCSTTAGYKNLSQGLQRLPGRRRHPRDLPGPAHAAVRHHAAVSFAALNLFITQVSWIRPGAAASGR